MEQNDLCFGSGEVDLRSHDDVLWTGNFLGQEKLILGHNEASYGTNDVNFGTGEVDIGSLWEELWDKTSWLFGTGEVEIET